MKPIRTTLAVTASFVFWFESPRLLAQTTAPIKAAPAAAPQVSLPSKPTMAPATPRAASTAAPVAPVFDEAAFKRASDAGAVVIVVFSALGDAIWDKQALELQTILRESEFNRTLSYQVDLSNTTAADAFLVKSAGTILVFKAGVERLRSTKMVKGDVIRKMLRLSTAL